MQIYRTASLAFLVLAIAGLLGWVVTRFTGPILSVSHEGFLLLTSTALMFVIGIALIYIAFEKK
jgi:hypothetical protein